MIFKNKKPKIEIFSVVPEITELAPILHMRDISSSLLKNVSKDYREKLNNPNYGLQREVHTIKCPTLSQITKQGFVVTTWQDITIETNGDEHTVQWTSAVDQSNPFYCKDELLGPAVSFHPSSDYSDFVPTHENSIKTIVKFDTPWRVIIPEGYYLLQTPVPYSDERRFTALPGTLDNRYGICQLNVHTFWHIIEGKTLIKAGTPLCRYVLVPIEEPELIIRKATKKDLEVCRLDIIEKSRKYTRNISESKCIFSKLMRKNK